MESSSSRNNAKKATQEEIKRKIEELKSQLIPEPEQDATPVAQPESPKRKAPEPLTLAPATPSPKKKRKLDHPPFAKPLNRALFQIASTSQQSSTRTSLTTSKPEEVRFKEVAPSNLLSNLASINRIDNMDEDDTKTIERSTGFKQKPKEIRSQLEENLARKRDERLALIEDLEPGPYEHTPPQDDPDFSRLEPNSGINLTSRSIPHEEFQDYLYGRYYLSPSRLYSAIRLLPDKQGYDVPVEGDWVTIAVVAERGPIKFTKAPVKIEREEGDQKEGRKQWKGKDKDRGEKPERPGKKFVNIKLIDFGARSGASSSTKAVIRGDAFLILLLFECDSVEYIDREDGKKPDKIYKGGSRGAFEHLTNVREGDVIALLNPKILKPFQRSSDTPHPVNNVLAVTPESVSSIVVLGRCRDLGMCQVRKQDGKVCGSWCDKRVSDVCDYHVQTAVQRRRAARPEFSVGTGGMSNASTHKRKHDYDPKKQWGLKPEEPSAGGNATYMISGHIVSGTSSDSRTVYATESIGREGQAKARRKVAGKEADRALKSLLERDEDGMRAVMKAREVGLDARGLEKKTKTKKAGKKNAESGEEEDEKDGNEQGKDGNAKKLVYSADIIKSLGFDPAMKPGHRRVVNNGMKNKLETLEAVRMARKDPQLGPRAGPRIRSGVMAPIRSQAAEANEGEEGRDVERLVGLDEGDGSDGEFPDVLVKKDAGKEKVEENMVDLDDF